MASRVAPGGFVGPRAVEEVAGESAQFGAVEVAFVVKRHAVPASGVVQAVADVAHRIRRTGGPHAPPLRGSLPPEGARFALGRPGGKTIRLAPCGKVRPQQLGIDPRALDAR